MNSKARIAVSQIIEKIELIAGIMIAALFALVGIICLPEEDGVGIAITCLFCDYRDILGSFQP